MWTLGTDWYEIVFRTTVVYLAVIMGVRFIGRGSLGQRTAVDFVLVLIVANAVQNAMMGPDTSLVGGLIAATTLFVLDRALGAFLSGHSRTRRLIEGTPVVLINNGQVVEQNLRKERLSMDELEEILQQHDIDHLGQVKMAILEMDGSVSIVPATAPVQRSHHKMKRG